MQNLMEKQQLLPPRRNRSQCPALSHPVFPLIVVYLLLRI